MINKINIADWKSGYVKSKSSVKLYEVPRNSVVTIETMDSTDVPIHFSYIDGAYSLCTILGTNEICHISASAKVFVWSPK